MSIKTRPFDAAEHLGSDKAIAAFVDEALGTVDAGSILEALAIAIRAKAMNEIAGKIGSTPASLYRDLNAGADLKFATVVRLVHALGFRLSVKPVARELKHRARTKAAGKGV